MVVNLEGRSGSIMKKLVISIIYIFYVHMSNACPTCTHDTYSSIPFFVPQIVQHNSIDIHDPIFEELFAQEEETGNE